MRGRRLSSNEETLKLFCFVFSLIKILLAAVNRNFYEEVSHKEAERFLVGGWFA